MCASIKILSGIYPDKNNIKAPDITLTDQKDHTILFSSMSDKPKIVFFGFTNCPSICPAALANISAALDLLGSDAEKIHGVFITTDPERDSPEVIDSYLGNFNKNIKGFTGSDAELKKIYKKYYVYSQKAPDNNSGENYNMNHSTTIYLLDESGEMVDHYPSDIDTKELAEKLKLFIHH
jgi:protein SCO1/2